MVSDKSLVSEIIRVERDLMSGRTQSWDGIE